MTAKQIISEIETLPPEEQAKVVRFAYRLDAERQLTGQELSALAERMVESTDPTQTAMLREEIIRGFYGGNRMPKVRRKNLPPALLNHLLDRVQERRISADQLGLLADWLAHEPDVPDGKWFKRFPGMTACGESEWVKTFLVPGQVPNGEEIE